MVGVWLWIKRRVWRAQNGTWCLGPWDEGGRMESCMGNGMWSKSSRTEKRMDGFRASMARNSLRVSTTGGLASEKWTGILSDSTSMRKMIVRRDERNDRQGVVRWRGSWKLGCRFIVGWPSGSRGGLMSEVSPCGQG